MRLHLIVAPRYSQTINHKHSVNMNGNYFAFLQMITSVIFTEPNNDSTKH